MKCQYLNLMYLTIYVKSILISFKILNNVKLYIYIYIYAPLDELTLNFYY
jgi:hypothetical protein